jgi:catechol 2,3-dioxygenase-like lactoylglutathione lyase family enzyme
MVVTHFIVSDDVERSRRFYTEVLGGTVVFGPESTNVALANSFIIINGGGGPTDDKPTVTLETPSDPDRVGASSISESQTSTPCTPSGAHGALSSLRRRSSTSTLLHPRSRRLHHRGRANHRSRGGLVAMVADAR